MKKVIFVLDLIFLSFCAFLLFFALLQFFLEKNIALCLALTLTLAFAVILARFTFLKNQTKQTKLDNDNQAKSTLVNLKFLSSVKIKQLFKKAFNDKGLNAISKNKYIYIVNKKLLVLVKFNYQELTMQDIVSLYNSLTGDINGAIITDKISAEIASFISSLDKKITCFDYDFAYELLKATDNLPAIRVSLTEKKPRAKLSALLQKKHAKRFFFFGAYFLFFSFFVTLKIYYIVCGSIFLIFAMCLRLFGKPPKEIPSKI